MQPTLEIALRGAAAGLGAAVVQAAIGKTEERAFDLEHGNSHLAPRLMQRLAEKAGESLSDPARWALGTAFHLGYGAFWGGSYALVRERTGRAPAALGAGLGALIYGITFPRWGGAVQTGTENPPERRSTGEEVLLLSVALGFGLATAYLYEPLRPRPPQEG